MLNLKKINQWIQGTRRTIGIFDAGGMCIEQSWTKKPLYVAQVTPELAAQANCVVLGIPDTYIKRQTIDQAPRSHRSDMSWQIAQLLQKNAPFDEPFNWDIDFQNGESILICVAQSVLSALSDPWKDLGVPIKVIDVAGYALARALAQYIPISKYMPWRVYAIEPMHICLRTYVGLSLRTSHMFSFPKKCDTNTLNHFARTLWLDAPFDTEGPTYLIGTNSHQTIDEPIWRSLAQAYWCGLTPRDAHVYANSETHCIQYGLAIHPHSVERRW